MCEQMNAYKKKWIRFNWYYAPVFLLFWLVLFLAVVQPLFLRLPTGLTMENEEEQKGKFVAERAQRILHDFERIGPKVTGSQANENLTVQLLHNEMEKIHKVMQHDLFELEVDVQIVSGTYYKWPLINQYQAIQNFVVKLSSKNSTSENYLLINSHFDTKPGSPGSGDDGAMVVVMLEILRVLVVNRETFEHPIVFLFNGAEELSLQASHGFITQHKWAKNCKVLINLDSAGSGNREIMFQSGPNHPWLMKYYSKYAIRPFAATVAEELFQSNIIPSDTDFRIFRDYGPVPGLDFAHIYNGYVYHTEFDKYDVIPRGTLQATGDNILSLAKGFANAPEMEDTERYSEGHAVFFDFLGLFFVHYTETQGKIINTCVSLMVIVLVIISIYFMASISYISIGKILIKFALILVLHLVGIFLAFVLPLLIAVLFDIADCSMTWFTSKWLVFGLYVCPSLFGLTLPCLLYLSLKQYNKLRKSFTIQLSQHAHAITLALLCMVGTFRGIRSSYLILFPLIFYGAALIINLITTSHKRGHLWCIFIILSQILPFIYVTYVFLIMLTVLIPMMGRFGAASNPDLIVSALCALGSVLSMGFVMPMWNMFRRPKALLSLLLVITFIFAMIAITPIGFPYRPETNVGRVNYMNVRRVFYEYDGSVSFNESGYYFDLQDRRLHHPTRQKNKLDCNSLMMCGLPLYRHQVRTASEQGIWIPSKTPVELPSTPKFTMVKKTFNASHNRIRFEFELSGPAYMSIFLLPLEGVTILDWSFIKTILEEPEKYQPPYNIYLIYGKLSTPLKFYFEFKLKGKTPDVPLLQLGISGHYISSEYKRGKYAEEFIKQFPDYISVTEWSSSYQRFMF